MRNLLMLIGLFIVTAVQALTWNDPVTGLTWEYDFAEVGVVVRGVDPAPDGKLVIPATINQQPVTGIGYWAFSGTALTDIVVPESLEYIEESALEDTPFANSLPDGLVLLGKVFYRMKSDDLEEFIVPSGVKSISPHAFEGCASLKSVVVPNGVKRIGDKAFAGCGALADVTIPGAWQLDAVFPDSPSITNVTFATGSEEIASYACSRHASLVSVRIPNGVRQIGYSAFSGCTGLKRVEIPSSATSISSGAFSGCRNLVSLTLPGYMSLSQYFPDSTNVKNVEYSEGSTEITARAFANSDSLVSVKMPESVMSIGDEAFRGCRNLTSVNIPTGITYVGLAAFDDTPFLEAQPDGLVVFGKKIYRMKGACPADVVIPDGIVGISSLAFAGRSEMKTLVIPASVASIFWDAFRGCSGLTSVTIPALPATVTSYVGNVAGFDLLFKDSPNLTHVTYASGETFIPDSALAGIKSVTSVTIPASVTRIGSRAFSDCPNLMLVNFLGDAPDMGGDVFVGCPRRLEISVPQGSVGWDGGVSETLPSVWQGRTIVHSDETYTGGNTVVPPSPTMRNVLLTTTNVVVHYLLNSVQPDLAVPVSPETGIVNVIAEVEGGAVAIPESWADNYPDFKTRFGNDFAAALTKPSGKTRAGGAPLFVWQDYVAGTDPTNPGDRFIATIASIDGLPQVGWTPELPPEEAAKRVYTIWGKARLQDEWVQVPDGRTGDYNFFKVVVKMR